MSNLYIKTELSSLIEAICYRPQLHVGNPNLHTIAAFIDGFAYAEKETYEEMIAFNRWLSNKLNSPPNLIWWGILAQKYSYEEFLIQLPLLFKEFKQFRFQNT